MAILGNQYPFRAKIRNERARDDDRAVGLLKILKDRRIALLVIHDSDPTRLDASFLRLDAPSTGTSLLLISGREATFGWSSEGGPSFDAIRLSPATMGFLAPKADNRLPAELGSDANFPELEPRSAWTRIRETWRDPLRSPTLRPAASDSASLYLRAFHDEARLGPPAENNRITIALAAALAVGTAAPPALAEVAGEVLITIDHADLIWGRPEYASPSAAILAIRSARAGVVAAPTDPIAHYLLGQAYIALAYTTRERDWALECRPLES